MKNYTKREYEDISILRMHYILHTKKKKFGNNNQVYELLMLRRISFNQMFD